MLKPGLMNYHYTDAYREQFDNANKLIIENKTYPDFVFLVIH